LFFSYKKGQKFTAALPKKQIEKIYGFTTNAKVNGMILKHTGRHIWYYPEELNAKC
jgi:hypothetical protein